MTHIAPLDATQITDPALPIRTPVSWSIWVWMALGAILGAFIFPAVVVTVAAARGVAGLAVPGAHSTSL